LNHRRLSLGIILAFCCVLGPAAVTADDAPTRLQDALVLGRSFSAVPLPDGLITVGAGVRTLNTVYLLGGQLERVSGKDLLLLAEWIF